MYCRFCVLLMLNFLVVRWGQNSANKIVGLCPELSLGNYSKGRWHVKKRDEKEKALTQILVRAFNLALISEGG